MRSVYIQALLAQLDRATSYPSKKALIMLFRGEKSERICRARAVTENNGYITLFEKVYGPTVEFVN